MILEYWCKVGCFLSCKAKLTKSVQEAELYENFDFETDCIKSTLRQRKNRKKESDEKCQEHLSNDQNRRLRKKATETAEEREERLARDCKRKRRKAGTSVNLRQESELPVIAVTINQNVESIATVS
ncbi:17879_t:CDS:2 [Dentiscutata erythropus]|uniref:17879_t:CDS:1 n=1 Tax=Dentiscutata erythropus TaxID=1348616 RepID=A0A9N9FWF7_9GLOM|nr:17879_t:CDS:2 [Dentiscutata erythropus]